MSTKLRSILIVLIVLVAAIGALVWWASGSNSGRGGNERTTSDQTLKIGTVLPLTGDYAEYGQNVLAALQLAADELSRGAGPKIQLFAEDDQAAPKQAVAALQKLIQVDGVRFIIGGFTSSSSSAMYPVAERAGVLMFSPSSSTPSLSENTPFFFRNWPSDAEQARTFARETFQRFGKKTANILYSNSEYGVNAKALFTEAYRSLGGKIPTEESYEPKATDFHAQVRKFIEKPADCIWLFGYYSEMGQFLKQARELKLRTQFFGQEGIEGQQLLDIAGASADGLIYFVPAFDANSPQDRSFVDAYKAKTGRVPEVFAAHAYDALNILVGSITKVGADPTRVANYLPTIQNYPGVAGTTSFDKNGDVTKPLGTKTIRDGKFVTYSAQ